MQIWAWNKLALLQKVLRETPPQTASWILYMRPDTMINDITTSFPFEMYEGRHWVSVGDMQSVLNGWASGELLDPFCVILTRFPGRSMGGLYAMYLWMLLLC